jgi:hypothetical protein
VTIRSGSFPRIEAVIRVVTKPPAENRPPNIEIYRHAIPHKFSPAFQNYNEIVFGVENFILEELEQESAQNQIGNGQMMERAFESKTFAPKRIRNLLYGSNSIQSFILNP